MNKLINLGFTLAGKWILKVDNIDFVLNDFKKSTDILYAFVSANELKYLGKTTKTLESRMKGYRKPGPSQFTNIRINALITKELQAENEVLIYILDASHLCEYMGYKVSLAAGLEDVFIRELNPKWNFHGKKKISNQIEEDDEINELEIATLNSQFGNIISITPFTKSYLASNFFNVPKKYSNLFGADGNAIRIEFNGMVYISKIDRHNVPSGAPRIHCGVEYNNWINKRFKIGDSMQVEVISPVSIKLF
jgi:hypothetical protein